MQSPGKRSAASRKAWRTRQLMKQARQEDRRLVEKLANDLMRQVDPSDPHSQWPPYMKRALPLPKIG